MKSKQIKVSEQEISDVLNECLEKEIEGGSKFPGMTYEQGVSAAINWLTGESDSNPMAD